MSGRPLDYILDVSFDASEEHLDELLQSRIFLTESTGSTSVEIDGTTTTSVFFGSTEDRARARELFTDVPGLELRDVDRERIDWLEHYQQSLEPLFIGERFIVVPDAALIPEHDERHTIIVPQEQAFGTGSHETTSLCIEILESLDLGGRRGIDIGAGSGILALAMLRLGVTRAIAFDNDVDAYGALRDNRMRNGISEEAMPLFIGSIEALRAGEFDVASMNIIPEVIIPLLGDVVPRLATDGSLILSGILVVKRDEVIAAAQSHGLRLQSERERGEWWAGVFVWPQWGAGVSSALDQASRPVA